MQILSNVLVYNKNYMYHSILFFFPCINVCEFKIFDHCEFKVFDLVKCLSPNPGNIHGAIHTAKYTKSILGRYSLTFLFLEK